MEDATRIAAGVAGGILLVAIMAGLWLAVLAIQGPTGPMYGVLRHLGLV